MNSPPQWESKVKMAVTYADMVGADPQSIWNAATWSNFSTFVNFYRLDAIANFDAEFGRRVLTLASPSTSTPNHWGRHHIPWKQHFHW